MNVRSHKKECAPYVIHPTKAERYAFPYRVPKRVPHWLGARAMRRFARSIRVFEEEQFLKRHPEHAEILIGRSQGLGDLLMLTPSLRELARVGWKVVLGCCEHFIPALRHNPHVHRFIPCEANHMPEYKCHNKINLNWKVERLRGKQLRQPRPMLFADLVNVEPTNYHPILVVTEEEREKAREATGGGEYIVIPAETSAAYRSYPRTLELVMELAKRGQKVVLTHHSKRYRIEHPNVVDLQRKIDTGTLCAVIEGAKLLISPDTGPMHIGLTLRTPTICLEGPMPPEIYTSQYKNSPKRILQRELPCLGCGHTTTFHTFHCDRNKRRAQECMLFDPGMVADVAEETLRQAVAA
jgi:ADP-heptose:LPS heptosyltransferase